MTLRLHFTLTRCAVLWIGMLFAAALAGCTGQQQPAQATMPVFVTQAPPAKALMTSTPGPTSSPTSSPTTRPTLRPSATIIPTATQLPSFTPAPSVTVTLPPTPFPTLDAGQPYMVYYSSPGGKPAVVLLNADASGRLVLGLPEKSQIPRLPEALSPDGKWLVFFTGATGDPQNSASNTKADLTLNLMHLPDGKVRTVAALLAADYPESLRKAAAQLVEKDTSKKLNQADVYNQILKNFLAGIGQAEWSPDGRTLAFTGEMKGLNANIYLFTPASGQLNQVTDSSEQVLWHLWSPDGKYILYGSSNQVCSAECAKRYALDVTNGKSTELVNMTPHSGRLVEYDWTGPHSIAFYSAATDTGAAFLTELDLATGKTRDLYPNAFIDFAVDSEHSLVALTANRDIVTQKNIQPGLYLYHTDGGKLDFVASSSATPDFSVVYWGQSRYPFLVWNNDKVYGLTGDGKLEMITENSLKTVASNREWIVVIDNKTNPPALKVIDGQKQVITTASPRYAGRMYPNPESTGFFSVYEKGLYYLDIKTGEWKQVDADLPDQPDWSSRALLFGWKP